MDNWCGGLAFQGKRPGLVVINPFLPSLEPPFAPLPAFLTADFNNLVAALPSAKFTTVRFALQRPFIMLGQGAPAGMLIAKGTTWDKGTINFGSFCLRNAPCKGTYWITGMLRNLLCCLTMILLP